MNIAIIPARGGSKRIPRKNIKNFFGRPMIAWSIEAALESECFDRVIVSTDDEEIAAVAKQYGAEIPFMRPAELADDYTGTGEVTAHAVQWLIKQGEPVQYACCIYATAPFIQADDLKQSLRQLQNSQAEYVFSATSYPFPIQRAIRINTDNSIEMFQPEHFNTRSQDLEEAWHDAGQFYWGATNAWLQQKRIFSHESQVYPLPRTQVQDIDTPEDWQRAELMFKVLQG